MNPPLSPHRHLGLDYHVAEAEAWLEASASGSKTTHLSYAAFELRLAVERMLFQYLVGIAPDQMAPEMLRLKAKQVEQRIYQLGGHQKSIDARFRFVEIMFDLLGEPDTLARPNIGKLTSYWHDCSELCHVAWTFGSERLGLEAQRAVYEQLRAIADQMRSLVTQVVAWPRLGAPWVDELQEQFARGDVTEEEVRVRLHDVGLRARIEYRDGESELFGEAVPPPAPGPAV
jgi:hypothetical protein